MMDLSVIKWFVNLPVCQKIGNTSLGKKLFNYETVTYIFFGALTTVINIAVFWLFDILLSGRFYMTLAGKTNDIGYLIANFIAWVVAMLFAFITNKLIVFKSSDMSKGKLFKEFMLFTLARVTSLLFEMIWMVVAVSVMGMNSVIAKVIANIIVVIINYIFSKLIIFKKK